MRHAWIWICLPLALACSESGDGGAAGAGGQASGGSAGQTSGGTGGQTSGGSAGSSIGGASGSAGTAGQTAGGAAGLGSGGSAGNAGAAGTAGSAGAQSCTPVSLGALIVADTEMGGSSLAYELQGLDATLDDVIYVEFFDVAGAQTTGSFDLSQAPDDNYSTCAHCLLGFEDVGGSSTPFYPESGSLEVTQADTQYAGVSAGNFNKVVLRESTL
ncbi:MAG: hypothetical protein KC492_33820, partial [Myxococcales bacterium]|nr:hypothetical protein [Myxococcales bacterium]